MRTVSLVDMIYLLILKLLSIHGQLQEILGTGVNLRVLILKGSLIAH